jgi:hypothetical protein
LKVNESLLQLWDYFLLSGWKAIIKMGLLILKHDSEKLSQMAFEEILNEINEIPKAVLIESPNNESTLYLRLKNEFKNEMLSFHIDRLA